ncbi:hypothetical protein Dtox_2815 [Desulfofarcimen acetoxidans DSM 771]|uniref:DUF4178 domain-containing protein n=1 Tax=Desulfofarcimen acetoxidans (strain ATCC 49208 / DSM 771 / KCTC 5769 / VKM B-1644 / 5575) TaxID=485916 RepID=C8W1V9_DESAS|nr:DUF4178 domain-containing protein [Desulfofarcimen acetoxidans]ACV63580.1 hypothetical protein Dtox_2815 [Desulfofarcimen acetoxidans DSM 771]
MGVFERISKILQAEKNADKPAAGETSIFALEVAQVISLDLEDWIIEAKVIYHKQPESVLYWLKSGRQRQSLLLDRSIPDKAIILKPFAGRFDEFNDVKTEYILDNKHFFLDFNGECDATASGTSPIGSGEIMFWQYETDQQEIYRIEWQSGRFFHYDGRWIDTFEISII